MTEKARVYCAALKGLTEQHDLDSGRYAPMHATGFVAYHPIIEDQVDFTRLSEWMIEYKCDCCHELVYESDWQHFDLVRAALQENGYLPPPSNEARAGSRAELSALFAAVFSDRRSLSAKTCVHYNLALGSLFLVGAVLAFCNPERSSALAASALAGVGLSLSAGVVVAHLHPNALSRTLTLHGVLLLLLSVTGALGSLSWALTAAAHGSFHYLPGVLLVLSTYGALHLAKFGPWPRASRRIRAYGVWFGLLLELSVLVGFALRLSARP